MLYLRDSYEDEPTDAAIVAAFKHIDNLPETADIDANRNAFRALMDSPLVRTWIVSGPGPAWVLEDNIGVYRRESAPTCDFRIVWSVEGFNEPLYRSVIALDFSRIARDENDADSFNITAYGGWRLRYYPVEKCGIMTAFPQSSIPDIIRDAAEATSRKG